MYVSQWRERKHVRLQNIKHKNHVNSTNERRISLNKKNTPYESVYNLQSIGTQSSSRHVMNSPSIITAENRRGISRYSPTMIKGRKNTKPFLKKRLNSKADDITINHILKTDLLGMNKCLSSNDSKSMSLFRNELSNLRNRKSMIAPSISGLENKYRNRNQDSQRSQVFHNINKMKTEYLSQQTILSPITSHTNTGLQEESHLQTSHDKRNNYFTKQNICSSKTNAKYNSAGKNGNFNMNEINASKKSSNLSKFQSSPPSILNRKRYDCDNKNARPSLFNDSDVENLIEWANNIKIENINENDYFITYFIALLVFFTSFQK